MQTELQRETEEKAGTPGSYSENPPPVHTGLLVPLPHTHTHSHGGDRRQS